MHPRQLSILDYTYTLPEDKIAIYPLAERDASKLLVCQEGHCTENTYRALPSLLPAHSLLVFNNTRVVEARLLFQKPTGGIIEIFCLEPHEQYPDITAAMAQTGKVWWKCLVGGASKWKKGQLLGLDRQGPEGDLHLTARYVEKRNDHFVIELQWTPSGNSFAEVLHQAGHTPLPPYLHRTAEPADRERYQTIFARAEGSVAAPTAGLHFTPQLMQALAEKNIGSEYLTLHVGAGTFQPVKAATMEGHAMHAEFIEVSISTLSSLLNQGNHPVIAVGTTSLRTLESLYWIGLRLLRQPGLPYQIIAVSQWEPYDTTASLPSRASALEAVKQWMEKNNRKTLLAKTQIIIAPGYQFRIISGLITNFHQPQSTLLLLVAALIGEDWKKLYQYALENSFRFLSYGDGCLLWPRSH